MEAIILAGGFGTRLRPLTFTRAKPLLPIINRPMISYLINNLPKQVDKVILAVNYRRDQIEQYFQTHNFGKELIINDEPKPLGTGGAVKFAEKFITGKFLVLNSDIISSLNLEKMIDFHDKNDAFASISLWPVKNVSEFGVVDVTDTGKIKGFVEKPKPEDAPSDLINAGAYCLESEVLDYIETGRLISMEKEIFPQIISDTDRFYGYEFKGYWMDIGRITSYINVHRFLLETSHINYVEGMNCEIYGDLMNTCLGNHVSIGKNCKLDSVIIYDNSHIGDNTVLSNCVIGSNCSIGGNSKITNSVVGDNENISEQEVLDNKIIWNQQKPEGYPDKQIGNVLEKQ